METLLKINRFDMDDKQTLGTMEVVGSDFECKTLELTWKNNEKRVSCIPIGKYEVIKRWSEKYGDHFHVLNVDNRSYILIHYGNYNHDTLGCILPGAAHTDINGDGYRDVTSSKATMEKLNELLPERFYLEIC